MVVNWDDEGEDGEVSLPYGAKTVWAWGGIGIGPWNDDVEERYVEDAVEGNGLVVWGFDAARGDEGMSNSSTILSSSSISSKLALELDRDLWKESTAIPVPLPHSLKLDERVRAMGVLHGWVFFERPRSGIRIWRP